MDLSHDCNEPAGYRARISRSAPILAPVASNHTSDEVLGNVRI